VTDVPALSSEQFRQVFLSLEAKLGEHPASRAELARAVRDDCVAAGQPVSRAAVNFVLQGLGYAGIPLTDETLAMELAAAWTKNVEELCRVALMEFDDAEKFALRRWASGGLLETGQTDESRV
jgi:hypothetical protein